MTARLLGNQVAMYAPGGSSFRLDADEIYDGINPAVFQGASSYEATLDYAIEGTGLNRVGAERRWRRCRQVYDEAEKQMDRVRRQPERR